MKVLKCKFVILMICILLGLTLQVTCHILLTISVSTNRMTNNMYSINCKTEVSVYEHIFKATVKKTI